MTALDHVPASLTRKGVGLFAGPAAFAVLRLFTPFALSPAANATLAVTLWMATWWVTEAIPIPATALLPVALFPPTGVLDATAAAAPYADPIVFLLLGGFVLAVAVERRDLHRRLALAVVTRLGVRSDRLLLGFMVATAGLSMWISNSATAMLMMPISAAVVGELEAADGGAEGTGAVEGTVADFPADPSGSDLGLALVLGIAYSASIGGVATLIGSPPNAVLAGVAASRFGVRIGFLDWLVFAGPIAAVFLLLAWLVLLRLVRTSGRTVPGVGAVLRDQRAALGRPSPPERRVLAVFALVAAGWVLRPFVIQPRLPGVTDGTVAVVGALLLFALPAGDGTGPLLDWTALVRVPWGVLVLLGGGFSLAAAFQASGLDATIAARLSGLAGVPLPVVLLVVAAAVVFLTEVTSNTATASVFVPVAAGLGLALGVPPLALMTAVALAASFAFMLPVATPPNAIAFGTGRVTVPQMAHVGLWLNLLGTALLVAATYVWLPVALRVAG